MRSGRSQLAHYLAATFSVIYIVTKVGSILDIFQGVIRTFLILVLVWFHFCASSVPNQVEPKIDWYLNCSKFGSAEVVFLLRFSFLAQHK